MSGHVEFMVDKVEQLFSKYFGFPCHFPRHQLRRIHYHPIIDAI
jgi:hypothetical protein